MKWVDGEGATRWAGCGQHKIRNTNHGDEESSGGKDVGAMEGKRMTTEIRGRTNCRCEPTQRAHAVVRFTDSGGGSGERVPVTVSLAAQAGTVSSIHPSQIVSIFFSLSVTGNFWPGSGRSRACTGAPEMSTPPILV
jgi:hypothetical protein